MNAIDRVRPRTSAPQRRYGSAGSLTAGPPLAAAQIRPGMLDFRTPILILALQPVIDPTEFALAMRENLRVAYGVELVTCGVAVGEPFWQALPEDNSQLDAAIVTLGASRVVGAVAPPAGAGTALVGIASLFGWAIGSGARYIANADRVIARWLTIEGTIDSRSRVTTPGEVTDCIAASLVATMRFRHPENGSLLDSQAESVVMRTLEPGACSGARRFDKVIAAACTRVWPSARPAPVRPAAPSPATAAPRPGTAPATLPPAPVEVRRPEPEAPVVWEGEGDAPPVPSGLDDAPPSAGVMGFVRANRRPIAGALALAAFAGIAAAFWPRRGAPSTPAPPARSLARARTTP